MNSKMNEYIINVPSKQIHSLIRELYKRFLKEDNKWFYSKYVLARTAGELRIKTSGRIPEMERYLTSRGFIFEWMVYTALSEKSEGSVVDIYWNEFVTLFHAESVLSLKTKDTHKDRTIERVVHMLFNMLNYSFMEEALWLESNGVFKAFTAGREYERSQKKNN